MARTFASDNNSGVHPAVLAALARVNEGHVRAYGDDPHTGRAVELVREALGAPNAAVFFVFNGTGANVLSLAALARPFDAVLCAEGAHVATDECNAPERFLGAKLVTIPTPDGKLTPALLAPHVKGQGVEHHAQPRVVSLTQCTELGTVYTRAELAALREFCDTRGLSVHMDGARLANAAASLGSVADAIHGVDVLSFGATKNGALAAEAVVFLRPTAATDFRFVRKQAMQLASKMRFLAAQFEALLADGLWLKNAQHSNAMARALSEAAAKVPGIEVVHRTQANEVFARLPSDVVPALQESCAFYVWEEGAPLGQASDTVRWVCSWDTTESDVQSFVEALASAMARRAQR